MLKFHFVLNPRVKTKVLLVNKMNFCYFCGDSSAEDLIHMEVNSLIMSDSVYIDFAQLILDLFQCAKVRKKINFCRSDRLHFFPFRCTETALAT